MDRRLIFLDIDGTLLPPGDMLIPESTLAALDSAKANGHKLFLCTGRNHRMTEPLLRHSCFAGAVCSAGGYVLCDGKTLVDIPMEPQQAEGVRAALERHGVECTLEARDATFGGVKMTQRWSFIHQKNGAPLNSEAERWRKAMEEGMSILPLSDYKGEPLYKIVFIADHESDLAEAKRLYADQFVFCESKLDNLTDGFVCSAGGYVGCDGKILVDLPMEPAQVEGLREVLGRAGAECTLEARDDTYGGIKMIERFAHLFPRKPGQLNSEAERWRKTMEYGMTIRPIEEYHGEPVYKVVFIAPNEACLAEAKQLYENQFIFCESRLGDTPSAIVNGELINRKFNKGTGIKAICDNLGCSLADTIGFGDSDNDLQMTDVVGISVCMANGSDNLKKLCDRICPAVTEDGVARELKTLGLI